MTMPRGHYDRTHRMKPLAVRHAAKIDKASGYGPWGDCWLWIGAVSKGGYGHLGRGRASEGTIDAHVVAYENAHGPLPDGFEVGHICNVRRCQNQDHLVAVTPQGNTDYMIQCGRMPRGSERDFAKLTEKDASEIKKSLRAGASPTRLGEQYGVSEGAIRQIIKGRTWKHVA